MNYTQFKRSNKMSKSIIDSDFNLCTKFAHAQASVEAPNSFEKI